MTEADTEGVGIGACRKEWRSALKPPEDRVDEGLGRAYAEPNAHLDGFIDRSIVRDPEMDDLVEANSQDPENCGVEAFERTARQLLDVEVQLVPPSQDTIDEFADQPLVPSHKRLKFRGGKRAVQ